MIRTTRSDPATTRRTVKADRIVIARAGRQASDNIPNGDEWSAVCGLQNGSEVILDIREAISGELYVKFATTTGGASNTIRCFLQPSYDGVDFVDRDITLMREVGTISCPNNTADHTAVLPLTADMVGFSYVKVCFYCSAPSNVTVIKDARFIARVPA